MDAPHPFLSQPGCKTDKPGTRILIHHLMMKRSYTGILVAGEIREFVLIHKEAKEQI